LPKSLYSVKEIKEVRERLVKEQKGIDPILKEPFPEAAVCDHDHGTQHVRAALSRNVNAFEGKILNSYIRCLSWLTNKPLPEILRNLADYLEVDYSNNPYHPAWIKRVTADFNKLAAKQQNELLGLCSKQGSNPSQRKALFNSLCLDRNNGYDLIKASINKVKEI
jgi:hypothetical protein